MSVPPLGDALTLNVFPLISSQLLVFLAATTTTAATATAA